jgi:DNA-directed RNA polymerase subunit M
MSRADERGESDSEETSAGEVFERITGETELTAKQAESEDRFRGEETESRPTTEVTCPRCGNDTAYWHLEQTRSADESKTRFFACTECGYRWWEYD